MGCRCDIMDSISYIFCILTYAIIYVLIHHITFWLYLYFLNILYFFFKYSCTNIYHRRSPYTFCMDISEMPTWLCRAFPIETFPLCLMVLFWHYSGNCGNAGKMCPLPEQTLGQQLSDHFPERNLQVPDQIMWVILWETLVHWEILGHVKTCHRTASRYWDTYELT